MGLIASTYPAASQQIETAALEGQRGKAPHKAPNCTLKVVPSSTEVSPAGSRTVAVKSCVHIACIPGHG